MYSLFTNYLEPISFFIYLLAAALYYRIGKTLPVALLLVYYVAAVGLMAYSATAVYTQQSNLWAYNLLFLLSGISIGIYFRSVFTAFRKKQIAVFLILLNAALCIVHAASSKNLISLNSYGFALLSLTVVTLGFMYFHQVINTMDTTEIYHQYEFWFVAGFILYYLGSFSVLVTYNYLTSEALSANQFQYSRRQLLTTLWGVHNSLLFLSSLLTLTGVLWISYRKR